jgi:hypothetical protein
MKEFKGSKRFEYTIQNNEYDNGAQNQMKKTKTRNPILTLESMTDHFASQS